MEQTELFDFKKYVESLNEAELKKFAADAGTTSNYIIKKLRYRYTRPSVRLVQKLAAATGGKVTFQNLLNWFYECESA